MATDAAVVKWLLGSDPAVRWQVLRDLLYAPSEQVAVARARVPREGWGAELLATQRRDGTWGGTSPKTAWPFNLYTLHLLRAFEPDPADPRIRAAIERTRDGVTWGAEFGESRFFDGEVEPCINRMTLSIGSFFGEPSGLLAARLVAEQQADGGWNCDAPASSRGSFHSTISVLEGLLDYRRAGGSEPGAQTALEAG